MALLVDTRFPGGTAAAVASEIRALAPRVDLKVHDLESALFKRRSPNPAILAALEEVGQRLLPEPPVVHADVVVLHNPTCLRFDSRLRPRLSAPRTIVVTHENFLRPDGSEGFDAAHCLDLVSERTAGGETILAPVSDGNRATVAAWLVRRPGSDWRLASDNWPNICDLPFLPPTAHPRDRRGRHSRPGVEKFPPLAAMRAQFPPHAERCAILGADSLLRERDSLPSHWDLQPFGAMRVGDFLAGIDFFVYFTHPLLRESYGRAIAEAVAAGKLVVTDPATAEAFGPGVVADDGRGVDGIVAAHISDPGRYAAAVLRAQADLARHRPEPVASRLLALIESEVSADAFL
ncbi:MAG: hypothetical protein U1E59_11220 [Amaricoccus sp.]